MYTEYFINETFDILFSYQLFKAQVHFNLQHITVSTATFQVLSSHVWLVASVLDSTDLGSEQTNLIMLDRAMAYHENKIR